MTFAIASHTFHSLAPPRKVIIEQNIINNHDFLCLLDVFYAFLPDNYRNWEN